LSRLEVLFNKFDWEQRKPDKGTGRQLVGYTLEIVQNKKSEEWRKRFVESRQLAILIAAEPRLYLLVLGQNEEAHRDKTDSEYLSWSRAISLELRLKLS
jgi:hypothetical protein